MKGLLTALDGGVYRMESGLARGDLEEARSGWDMLRLRIERIRKMVLDVLYYTKSRELELTEVDLQAFVKDLAAIIKPKAEKEGIGFLLDSIGAEGTLEADAPALSSAMVNLLENALDACHMDRTKNDHAITCSAKRSGSRVVFEITDNGLGMDQETKNNLFTLFFSSKGSRGTGIGLFVSNHVITLHHGRISVESEYGKGTRIQVEIPAQQTLSSQSIGYPKDAERHVLGAELH
jgi:signal transduction histidine kinase